MNCDFQELFKDNNVRLILQDIHRHLLNSKASPIYIDTTIPSLKGKLELIDQDREIDNDEYLIRCLSGHKAISNIKILYDGISFEVVDRQFLQELCDMAADSLVLNLYPLQEQQNIVLATINVLRNKIKNDNITLTWDEFVNSEDTRRIQIAKTLHNLHQNNLIELVKLEYDLLQKTRDGKTNFQAEIIYNSNAVSLSENIVQFKSFTIDTKKELAYYPPLGKWVGFDKRNKKKVLYDIMLAFVKKEINNKFLTDAEILQIIGHRGKTPTKLQSHQLDKIIEKINHLKNKFHNNKLFVRDDISGCYRLIP